MAGVLRRGLRAPTAAASPISLLGRQTALLGRIGGGADVYRTAGVPAALIPRLQQVQQVQQLLQRRTFAASALRLRRPTDSSPSVAMSKGVDHANGLVNFRIPQTFVPPDWRLYLTQPSTLAPLYWASLKSRFTEFMAELSVRIQSKQGWFGKARFRPNRKALLPLAKNLHYEMLEATAAADMPTLRRILTRAHLDEVETLIAHRPRGQKCTWELLSYRGRPRMTSHKVVIIPGTNTFVRQAVVTIRSRQRFTWQQEDEVRPAAAAAAKSINNIDTTNKNVRRRTRAAKDAAGTTVTAPPKPPTVVEKDVKENIVLMATMDPSTYKTSEWRIFGFLPDTTLYSWQKESALMDKATKASKEEVRLLKLKRKKDAAAAKK